MAFSKSHRLRKFSDDDYKPNNAETTKFVRKRHSAYSIAFGLNDHRQDFSSGLEYEVLTNTVFSDYYHLIRDDPHNLPPKRIPNENYADIIKIREKSSYEIIETYIDPYPLLEIRKSILIVKSAVSEICSKVIQTSFFEFLTILVILTNTVTLAIDDPTAAKRPDVLNTFDSIFLFFYSFECILKVFSLGFIFNKKAYLRDSWNVLDFIIVISAWIDYALGSSVNLQALRALRVLRPLRSISSVEGLRVIFIALISSIKPLIAALTLFIFLITIFAIAGLQLWSGMLKYRCMDLETGFININQICGAATCSDNYLCVKSLDNPNYGITNFDNFLFSALTIYQCITLEGWTNVMISTQMAFNDFSIILFIPLVFIGAFIFLNLTLAIIKSAFSKSIVVVKPSKNRQNVEEVSTGLIIKHLTDMSCSMNKTRINIKSEESLNMSYYKREDE
ncbi:hypothetical protein SteCoe_1074 [Stentor coeruleus]|uniref:Ion transport domain-containing protein n=1 Tax=Stentor coeruleus TaxID=5963 RepID=A0A1R2D2M5_9CILI|nr:hypothetical protein SteCoe_1074 [Stentor coeruleus]